MIRIQLQKLRRQGGTAHCDTKLVALPAIGGDISLDGSISDTVRNVTVLPTEAVIYLEGFIEAEDEEAYKKLGWVLP